MIEGTINAKGNITGSVSNGVVFMGGTNNYNELENKPTINDIELLGNLTTEELGILEDVKNYINENKEELKGKDGVDGKDGQDGYTPIKGVDYFDGKDGEAGQKGASGKDGYTPIKGVDYFDGVDGKDGYTPIKGKDYFDGVDGKDGSDGYTPVKGTDYFTEADKQEMVNSVINSVNEELGLLIDEINGEVI